MISDLRQNIYHASVLYPQFCFFVRDVHKCTPVSVLKIYQISIQNNPLCLFCHVAAQMHLSYHQIEFLDNKPIAGTSFLVTAQWNLSVN